MPNKENSLWVLRSISSLTVRKLVHAGHARNISGVCALCHNYQAENRVQRKLFSKNESDWGQTMRLICWFLLLCGFTWAEQYICRKIRLIESNAKCRYLKNWLVKGLCGRCVSLWGPLLSYDPILRTPPPYTLYTCIQHIYSPREGVGRANQEKRLEGTTVHKTRRKYQHDWLYLQSVNSIKHQ